MERRGRAFLKQEIETLTRINKFASVQLEGFWTVVFPTKPELLSGSGMVGESFCRARSCDDCRLRLEPSSSDDVVAFPGPPPDGPPIFSGLPGGNAAAVANSTLSITSEIDNACFVVVGTGGTGGGEPPPLGARPGFGVEMSPLGGLGVAEEPSPPSKVPDVPFGMEGVSLFWTVLKLGVGDSSGEDGPDRFVEVDLLLPLRVDNEASPPLEMAKVPSSLALPKSPLVFSQSPSVPFNLVNR